MTHEPSVEPPERDDATIPFVLNGHAAYPDVLYVESLCEEDIPHFGLKVAFYPVVYARCWEIYEQDVALFYELEARLVRLKIPIREWEKGFFASKPGPPVGQEEGHETLTELLAATIPPPMTLLENLLHEGMILFGGKSKRGKSWLIFDLAISVAIGRAGFGHFACPAPQPVLFLALEDGRRRLQTRARAIQANLMTVDNFHLRYRFETLGSGGIDHLTALIEQYHYGLIVIDVLAKLEAVGKGKGEKSYHEVYTMFDPLQELRKKHPFALMMLTHLRKQEAEDAFDSLHGSVAYQGAQDMLWVLERKPNDPYAFLHMRGKDVEETTIALHQQRNGPWEYIGEGEEYTVNRDQRLIMKVLQEEKDRDLSIQELLKACGIPETRYAYVRKVLSTMVKNDLIHRTQRGKYAATLLGIREMAADDNGDIGDVPF